MDKYFLFSVLKQMRKPIITMLIFYAIAISGLVAIEGVTDKGEPYDMGIFHAIYVAVYTSTTIGFGEIPYAWTDNQRLWVLIISIFGAGCWLYAAGKLIALSQNKIFKDKLDEYRFESLVKKNKQSFYIMCGFGITGKNILKLMSKHKLNVVLIDNDPNCFESKLSENEYNKNIPHIVADCSNIDVLKMAGLHMPNCKGVLIVTGNEEINVKTAMSCKLLSKSKKLFVRADKEGHIKNLNSFGTEQIISHSNVFYKDLDLIINRFDEYSLNKKLNCEIKDFSYTPKIPKGKWIICGLNSTTKKLINVLEKNKTEFVILSEKKSNNKTINNHCINSDGVSSEDLINADIKNASVIFAAKNEDFKNLSAIMTAKELNPEIFSISIQNKSYRDELFEKLNINLLLQPQYKIAEEIHSLISEPYLYSFFKEINNMKISCVQELEKRIPFSGISTWHFRINKEKSFHKKHLKDGNTIILANVIPIGHHITTLMVKKSNGDKIIAPDLTTPIEKNDVILFAGKHESFCRQRLMMYNINVYEEYQNRYNKKV